MRVRPRKSARHPKKQYLFAAVVPALIVTLSITGFVWAQHRVTVVVDGRARTIETHADDVSGALVEAGIVVREQDVVTPSPESDLRSGMTIVVRHAVPVRLDLGGRSEQVEVIGETVADALVAVGIDPSANPAVTPALDAPLEKHMTVSVPDVFVRVVSDDARLSAPTKYRKVPNLPKGERRVASKGRDGKVLRVYRVLVSGGVEGEPVLTAERVVAEPQPGLVLVGTGQESSPFGASAEQTQVSPRSAASITGRRMRVVTTGYSPAQPGLGPRTATGALARRGVVAVDPRVIPLGTRLFVPGYGYAVAADTGGAVRGRHVDLCFASVEEARRWGRRSVTIVILD